MNPIKGTMPVPGPIITTGVTGSFGIMNIESFTNMLHSTTYCLSNKSYYYFIFLKY